MLFPQGFEQCHLGGFRHAANSSQCCLCLRWLCTVVQRLCDLMILSKLLLRLQVVFLRNLCLFLCSRRLLFFAVMWHDTTPLFHIEPGYQVEPGYQLSFFGFVDVLAYLLNDG